MSALGRFLDRVLVTSCPLCGRAADAESPLCSQCARALEPIRCERRCRRCSLPLISEALLCTRCRSREYAFEAHLSCYEYRGVAMATVRAFKFAGHHRLVHRIVADLARVLPESWRGLTIVPVPARRASMRRRDYDPVALLARELSRELGSPIWRALERRGGGSQKKLDFAHRLENLANRIVPRTRWPARAPVTAERVLLLDDVFTTGATIHECSLALRALGVKSVVAATVTMEF